MWALALGAALGTAAWGEGRVPVAALALPLLVATRSSRLQAFFLAFGYAAGVLRHAVSFIACWFDGELMAGWALVGTCALVTGAVWCGGWSDDSRPLRRAAQLAAVWCLALLAGVVVPGHPLIGAGFLLPNTGWSGVLLACVLPCAGAAWLASCQARGRRAALVAVLTCACVARGWLSPVPKVSGQAGGIAVQGTAWGRLASEEAALGRLQRIGGIQTTAQVVVWPESIVGRYTPALRPVLEVEVLRRARVAGRTTVIGLDLPATQNRLRSAAVAFHPDGSTEIAYARQPVPLALWRPWRAQDSFVANWSAPNLLHLGNGQRAAVIFCFEEYLPVLYLLNELRDRPTLYLALANTWAAPDRGAAIIQTWHSLGMARLFGRPYLKAENRSAP